MMVNLYAELTTGLTECVPQFMKGGGTDTGNEHKLQHNMEHIEQE